MQMEIWSLNLVQLPAINNIYHKDAKFQSCQTPMTPKSTRRPKVSEQKAFIVHSRHPNLDRSGP